MKKHIIVRVAITVLLLTAVGLTSCSVRVKEKTLPPGQAKKITGSQSAALYASGHNKLDIDIYGN